MTEQEAPILCIDPKGGAPILLLREEECRHVSYRFFSIRRYQKDVTVDFAKGLILPTLRGTWLPSFDIQVDFGLAINWLGIRVRVSPLG